MTESNRQSNRARLAKPDLRQQCQVLRQPPDFFLRTPQPGKIDGQIEQKNLFVQGTAFEVSLPPHGVLTYAEV